MRSFRLLAERLAIVRLDASSPAPTWPAGPFVSVTRTSAELSIVCDEGSVPPAIASEGGWRALQLEGVFDLDETGIAAHFAGVLATSGVAVFIIATHDTDYVLVREARLAEALSALRAAGYRIRDTD